MCGLKLISQTTGYCEDDDRKRREENVEKRVDNWIVKSLSGELVKKGVEELRQDEQDVLEEIEAY